MRTALVLSIASASLLAACGPKNAPPPQPPITEAPPAEPAPEPVAPIPEGWFAITPQLVVPDIDAAIAFYGTAFGAQPVMSMPGPDGKTMHAEVKIGDSLIMLEAESPDMKSPKTLGGTTAGLMIYTPDVDTAFQSAVDAGATVKMPVADMFWGDRYGVVIDPAGHQWSLATHTEDLTPEQMAQRAPIAAKARPKGKKPLAGKKLAKIEAEWKAIAGTPAAAPVPEGYHTVTLALTVNDAASALAFYTGALGGTEMARMPRADGKIEHAEVKIGDSILMLNDEDPTWGAKSPKTLGAAPVMVHHYVTDVDATFGKAVGAGAQEFMPVGVMFWGDRYGGVVAPDGYAWGMATHVEDVTLEQMKERMKTEMAAAEAGGAAPAGGGDGTPASDQTPPGPPPAPAAAAGK